MFILACCRKENVLNHKLLRPCFNLFITKYTPSFHKVRQCSMRTHRERPPIFDRLALTDEWTRISGTHDRLRPLTQCKHARAPPLSSASSPPFPAVGFTTIITAHVSVVFAACSRAATPSSAQQHAAHTASLSGRWPAAPARALRVEWVAYLTGVSPQTNGESRTGGKTSRQLLAMWSLSAEYEHAHIHIHNQTRGLHVLHAATLRG